MLHSFLPKFKNNVGKDREIKIKTEGQDSQSIDSVLIITSDTPISPVMTADFLYPTKAKACIRLNLDKYRVNHLDINPDLSVIRSI